MPDGCLQEVSIFAFFWKELPDGRKSLTEVLEYLLMVNTNKIVTETDGETGKTNLVYKLNIEE